MDRNALVTALRARDYYPVMANLLALDNYYGERFELLRIDFAPPASGPEAELTYRVPERVGSMIGPPEEHVRREVGRCGLAVVAARERTVE